MIKLKNLLNEVNDADYKKAALELVKVAEPMVKGKGYVDNMNDERRMANAVKTGDQLSDLYYHIKNVLAGSAEAKDSKSFPKKAKEIIVDKYKLEITDEYGFKMKYK